MALSENVAKFSSAQLESHNHELLPSNFTGHFVRAGKANYSVWFFFFSNFCIWTGFNDLCVREGDWVEVCTGVALMVGAAVRYGDSWPSCASAVAHCHLWQLIYPSRAHVPQGIALCSAGSLSVSPRGTSPCEGKRRQGRGASRHFACEENQRAVESVKKPRRSVEIEEEEEGLGGCGYVFMYIRVYVCRYMYIFQLAKCCLLFIPSARRCQGTGRQPGPQGPAAA